MRSGVWLGEVVSWGNNVGELVEVRLGVVGGGWGMGDGEEHIWGACLWGMVGGWLGVVGVVQGVVVGWFGGWLGEWWEHGWGAWARVGC